MAEKLSIVPKTAFFEISHHDGSSSTVIGRVQFSLFANAPRTALNFGRLCEKDYKGVFFHRVIPQFMCQFGDTTEAKFDVETGKKLKGTNGVPGTGGLPGIGGKKFADEASGFQNKHKVGALSMANAGPNTNGSQIFICTSGCEFLDGKHVVFGEVKSGMDVIKKVESFGSESGDIKGRSTLYVSDSGIEEYHLKSDVVKYLVPKKAFFKVTVNGQALGDINLTLYKNTPVTALNFGELCKGFMLPKQTTTHTYANTFFHRVIPGFMAQFGDITEAKVDDDGRPVPGRNRRPGTGGIPGVAQWTNALKFSDENFVNKHSYGKLSMANSGKNTNGSQIFMCTAPCAHLDGKHVVFGEVDEASYPALKKVESYGSGDGTTSATVIVSESGVTEYFNEEESFTNQQAR